MMKKSLTNGDFNHKKYFLIFLRAFKFLQFSLKKKIKFTTVKVEASRFKTKPNESLYDLFFSRLMIFLFKNVLYNTRKFYNICSRTNISIFNWNNTYSNEQGRITIEVYSDVFQ